MSDTTPAEAPATETTEQPGDPVDALGEGGKKALIAEREARKAAEQSASALQKQLDEINAAKLTDIERAQKAAADAQTEAEKARSEVLRYKIAAENGITANAELILTASDEETMRKQAALWVERTPTSPKPDPSQGARGGEGNPTTGDQFASVVGPMFTT